MPVCGMDGAYSRLDGDLVVLGRDEVLGLIEAIRAQAGMVEAYTRTVVR